MPSQVLPVCLTRPLHVVPTDQRTPEVEERLVNVGLPLIAHFQPSIAVQPRQRPLYHPTVPS